MLGSSDRGQVEELAQGSLEPRESQAPRFGRRSGTVGRLNAEVLQPATIRMASLEAMLPDNLEKHVQLNRARLDTYAKLRAEILLYTEAKSSGETAKVPQASRPDVGGPSAMDIDSLG